MGPVKDQIGAAAGAVCGATLLLTFGVFGPLVWAIYLILCLGLVQPRPTRSFGIGLCTGVLAVAAFIVVRALLDP
ncbi:hypothetical protein GCM10009624_23090 [Gordonia sinesedis]